MYLWTLFSLAEEPYTKTTLCIQIIVYKQQLRHVYTLTHIIQTKGLGEIEIQLKTHVVGNCNGSFLLSSINNVKIGFFYKN